jgi:hypothetical protein
MTLLEQILLESSYEDMFKNIPDVYENPAIHKQNIKNRIQIAKNDLKKKDRITWYLRFSKLKYIESLLADRSDAAWTNNNNSEETAMYTKQHDALDKLLDEEIARYNKKTKGKKIDRQYVYNLNIRQLMHSLEHYLSLPFQKIQDYEFAWQTAGELLSELGTLEKEWQAEVEANKGLIPVSDTDKVLIDFKDGYYWVDLQSPSCRREADAMGHCGNVPTARPSQTIFSLRNKKEVAGKQNWKPHLTFIFDKTTGMFGEMKGRNNDKPDDKYHKYIIPLLKLKIVKGIEGGGYMPESNFAISDLPEATAKTLLKKKPKLGRWKDHLKLFGIEHPEVKEGLKKAFKDIDDHKTYPIVIAEMTGSELVEEYGNDTAKWIIKVMNGEEYLHDAGYDYDNSDIRNALSRKNDDALEAYVEKKYPERSEEPFMSVLEEEEPDIHSQLKMFMDDGYRSGTEAEMAKDIQLAVENPTIDDDNSLEDIIVEMSEKNHFLDAKYKIRTNIKSVVKLLEEFDEIDEPEDIADHFELDIKIKVDAPYNGYSEFDEVFFNELVENDIIDNLDK